MSGDHNQYQKDKSYLDFECPRCGHCCQALEEKREPRIMDREDIIRMAKEAGFEVYETDVWITDGWWLEELERFAKLVAAAERDQILELFNREGLWDAEGIAHAIHARSEK